MRPVTAPSIKSTTRTEAEHFSARPGDGTPIASREVGRGGRAAGCRTADTRTASRPEVQGAEQWNLCDLGALGSQSEASGATAACHGTSLLKWPWLANQGHFSCPLAATFDRRPGTFDELLHAALPRPSANSS